jgi:hypothetical protein
MLQKLLDDVRELRSQTLSNRKSIKSFRAIADRLASIETIILEEQKTAGEEFDSKQIPLIPPDQPA